MPVDSRISARRFDFSRETFDSTKHRRSVVALQGSVTVEADYNEQRRIDLHRNDTTTRDVIGPVGVPSNSNGFLITANNGDLSIGAGQIYVEGILCENETDCSLLSQPDLPFNDLNDVPGFITGPGVFAVELKVWERDITPIDDQSLLEKALGGTKTSGRTETVWQVVLKQQSDLNVTCATATIDTPAAHDGMLRAQTVPSAAARDCTLPPLAGYQGLENQLYRVEIHQVGAVGLATFKWSRENASVVTGIVASPQTGVLGQTFNVQSIGGDQTLGFAANQWVELIDDDIEFKGDAGTLAFIQTVDPAQQQITLSAPPSGTIDLAKHPKIRRWDQTDPAQSAGVPTGGGWIPLENGIQVSFHSGTYQPGDYWIIPARTAIDETTGVLDWPTSWQPAQFAARHVALLAVVTYDGTNFSAVHDCRPKFDDLVTLTERKAACCCTVSVGDGTTSFGDYTSINQALAALPAEGGEICILAGSYSENVVITDRSNIRIHGCHGRTILTGVAPVTPVIAIENSQSIVIRALTIATDTAAAISMEGHTVRFGGSRLRTIALEDLDITVRDAAAIVCRSGQNIRIAGNDVRVKPLAVQLTAGNNAGHWPAIYVQADKAEILKNSVRCAVGAPLTMALGGIRIGGGSRYIMVRRNLIEGGNGDGITLGSVTYIPQGSVRRLNNDYAHATAEAEAWPAYSSGIIIDSAGCTHADGGGDDGGTPTGSDGTPLVPLSEGILTDIRILDNDISRMGRSGIADFDPPRHMRGHELVVLLDIERNRISHCAMLDRGATGPASTLLPGRGGISLRSSETVTVRDNMIVANGRDFARSICGIWTGLSYGIVIERNQILENGPHTDTNHPHEPGPRGGIVLGRAVPVMTHSEAVSVETGYPAARVHDNIVATSSGPALAILGWGTISVQNNQLTSHGRDQPSASPYPLDQARAVLGGCAVFVWNLGTPLELENFVADYRSMALHVLTRVSDERISVIADSMASALSGDIMFNDNEVLMDGPNAARAQMFSAVSVLSFGDISFEGNQCNANLGRYASLGFNGLLAAWSLRAADNRFQETIHRAAFSGATLALMNFTTGNQGTHCFAVVGFPTPPMNANLSLIDMIDPRYCSGGLAEFGKAAYPMGLAVNSS